MFLAKDTKPVFLGGLTIGGGAPVAVQTMTNTDTRDVTATLDQIGRVVKAGAEVVRVAVPDETAARALAELRAESPVPLIADIHFDWRLALLSIKAGVAGLRLNPGNIGGSGQVRRVAEAAGAAGLLIRVGVNAGSLEKEFLRRDGHPTPEALVESALRQCTLLEETGFTNLKVSLKASNVPLTLAAVRLWAQRSPYPQHLGLTEAGDLLSGAIKSSVALGALLSEGLGDTIRVSLTAPPEEEVRVGWEILRAAGRRQRGVEIISCPTCGRCQVPLIELAAEVKRRLTDIKKPLRVAVMGCVVNGPGEAREADLGLAGGRDQGIVFVQGRTVAKVPVERLAEVLEVEARKMI